MFRSQVPGDPRVELTGVVFIAIVTMLVMQFLYPNICILYMYIQGLTGLGEGGVNTLSYLLHLWA